MRAMLFLRTFLLACLVAAAPAAEAQLAPVDAQALSAFAEKAGLRDVAGFVETVQSLRANGKLPPRYVTKYEAAAHGWHGGGLCAAWPGHVIGGDAFNNAAGVLPGRSRDYREADLDESCHSRGAKRLLFSRDGTIFVSPDHYRNFVPVP